MISEDYEKIIIDSFNIGCRKIQFIGGEPTLNPNLPHYLELSNDLGYKYIEVYSNLNNLSQALFERSQKFGINFATSFYSSDEDTHDRITETRGSFRRTVRNIKKLIDGGIALRVGVVQIDGFNQNFRSIEKFLTDIGVARIHFGITREFGRGAEITGRKPAMKALCGACASGKLCVAPNGQVFPCVMSREWELGNVLHNPLSEILASTATSRVRRELSACFASRAVNQSNCNPDDLCDPYCQPSGDCPQSCNPHGDDCHPTGGTCAPDVPVCDPFVDENPCGPVE